MTLNGVMAVILRYFSEFSYLPGVLRKSSRSLSHLLMSSCLLWRRTVPFPTSSKAPRSTYIGRILDLNSGSGMKSANFPQARNSICSICCVLVVQQAVRQIHRKPATAPQKNRTLCSKSTTSSQLESASLKKPRINKLYTVNQKKRGSLFLTITLANLNRFL